MLGMVDASSGLIFLRGTFPEYCKLRGGIKCSSSVGLCAKESKLQDMLGFDRILDSWLYKEVQHI